MLLDGEEEADFLDSLDESERQRYVVMNVLGSVSEETAEALGDEIGELKSSAQITVHYTPEELVGKLVMGVVNFPPRQIGKFRSEALVLGVPDETGEVVLLTPDKDVPVGGRMF